MKLGLARDLPPGELEGGRIETPAGSYRPPSTPWDLRCENGSFHHEDDDDVEDTLLGAMLGSCWAVFGPCQRSLGPFWASLGSSWGHVGPS